MHRKTARAHFNGKIRIEPTTPRAHVSAMSDGEQRSGAMSAADWGLLVALGTIWGGSFFFAKVALAELPPLTIVLGRVGFAALALGAVLPLLGQGMPRDRESWRAFAVMAALNNVVPMSLLVWGQSHIASGLASILNATTPFFTVLVAHFLTTDERLTYAKLAGVGVGLAGAVVIVGPDVMRGFGSDVWGELACLGAPLSYAFAGVYGRRFKRMGLTPLATATGQVTAATLLMLPLVLAVDHPWSLALPSARTWGAVLGIALLCTAIAYILYFRILASAGATNLLLVTFLIPVSAILLGALFLDERLAARHFLGMALIGLALVVMDGRVAAMITRGRSVLSRLESD
jgi:drug/metabolite transporter (DMT)-like permease